MQNHITNQHTEIITKTKNKTEFLKISYHFVCTNSSKFKIQTQNKKSNYSNNSNSYYFKFLVMTFFQ